MRPSREESLFATAFVWAKRSTCSRLQVGAVIHREGRILVQGYNGAPSGLPHCIHHEWQEGPRPDWVRELQMNPPEHWREMDWFTMKPPLYFDGHKLFSGRNFPGCVDSVHAEQNAIAFAARHGVRLEGSEMVVTHQPCKSCAMSIINAGISSVTYVHPYRLKDGIDLLAEAGIQVEQNLDWEEPRLIEFIGDES